jgi:hypothetical protein
LIGNFTYLWYTIRNHRDTTFNINSLNLSDNNNFSLDDNSGFEIPPFSEYSIPIIFNPVEAGDIGGILYINSDELYGNGFARLELNGFGKVTVGTEDEESIPRNFKLNQNYPNPFNPSTTISFRLLEESNIKMSIYDMAGRLINELVDETMTIGSKTVYWDGLDKAGVPVSGGVYFYNIQAGDISLTKKMILLK